MNRKDIINKSVTRSIFGNLIYVIILGIILAVGVYFAFKILFPKEATAQNVKEDNYYTFTGIKAENKYVDEGRFIYITLINEKNEAMTVCVDTEKKAKEVMAASKDKPFKFKGQSYIQSSEYIKRMHELYKNKNKNITYLYPFGLLDYRITVKAIDFIFPVAFLIAFIVNLLPIIKSLKLKKKAIEFLDNNPFYNERVATKQIHKYVELLNEYIILMSSTPAFINISESREIVITRHKSYFITTRFTLSLLDKEGKRRTYNMPKLKKEKVDELLNYINNYNKATVGGV